LWRREVSMKKDMTVLYHADADGFGSAFVLWLNFGESAHYIAVQYGQPVPEIPEGTESVAIVDFSYDRQTCETLAKKYKLHIYDHHRSAEKELASLPYVTFDQTKSGCGIVWSIFNPAKEMPDILQYIQDRDLWKFELACSEEINLYISTLEWEFEIWKDMLRSRFAEEAFTAGKAIKSFRDRQIKGALRDVRMMRFGICDAEHEIPVVNCSANVSEVGNVLCEQYPDAPFSASYCDRDTLRSWSLRSKGDFDVSVIAKSFGGGGHKNAAGFHTEIGWPQYDSDEFIREYEKAASK